MKLLWEESAWNDYLDIQILDKKLLKRINLLIKDICRNNLFGLGKPEILTGNLSGYYSRRVDEKNRIVYKIEKDYILIIACKGHYLDK